MDPWYKVAPPRKEVREGRSFNPDEFAIALEQVVAGRAPEDYQNLSNSSLAPASLGPCGELGPRAAPLGRQDREYSPPVQTFVTQMGGGKTHMLTSLWHLANRREARRFLRFCPTQRIWIVGPTPAKVAVFVGNAWDPQPGRETPWIDVARQLAGDEG